MSDVPTIERIVGSTLVMPCVSMGNIPQLTVDLLIHTFSLVHVGDLVDLYLYPFVSPIDRSESEPAAPGKFATALQVYYSKEHDLTVIQQRSPLISQFRNTHITEVILPFIQQHKFARILVLDSCDAGLSPSGHGKPVEVIDADVDAVVVESLAELKLHDSPSSSNRAFSPQCQSYIRGISDIGSPTPQIILAHVYEGDNFHDAEAMATSICPILGVQNTPLWERPISWKGVYGDRPIPRAMEEGLYG